MILAPETPERATAVLGKRSVLPGLQLSNVNPAVVAQYALPLSATGVVVEVPGPYGARAGLRPGDILEEINGEAVRTSTEARDALTENMRVLSLEVKRGLQRLRLRFRL